MPCCARARGLRAPFREQTLVGLIGLIPPVYAARGGRNPTTAPESTAPPSAPPVGCGRPPDSRARIAAYRAPSLQARPTSKAAAPGLSTATTATSKDAVPADGDRSGGRGRPTPARAACLPRRCRNDRDKGLYGSNGVDEGRARSTPFLGSGRASSGETSPGRGRRRRPGRLRAAAACPSILRRR